MLNKVKENQMLVQPNVLTEAQYDLTKHENNIILMGLGLINTTLVQDIDEGITFDMNDLYKASKSKLRIDRYRSTIMEALHNLFRKELCLADPVTNDFVVYAWLSELRGNIESSKVTLYLNPRLVEMFSALEGNYTQCLLKYVLPLQTSHAKRIYQYCLKYKPSFKSEVPEISLQDFRKMTTTQKTYTDYNDLNRYVITPAIIDINKITDITIKLHHIKTGKNITGLKFSYKFKSKEAEKMYLPKTPEIDKSSFAKQAKKAINSTSQKPVSEQTTEERYAQIEKENKR